MKLHETTVNEVFTIDDYYKVKDTVITNHAEFTDSPTPITSLKGAPSKCIEFRVTGNQVTSLVGGPTEVERGYFCDSNMLTNLVGAPDTMPGGMFDCDNNKLTSLIGAPREVKFYFSCNHNKLTSLEHVPTTLERGSLHIQGNKIESLKDIHKKIKRMGGEIFVSQNPLKSHVLGVLLINGCTGIRMDNFEVENILKKYIGKGMPGVLQAQEELIDAGFEEFAQL